jgi:preprotein translocase subunit SecG
VTLSPLEIIVLINSVLLIGLVLTQNENTRNSITTQSSNLSTNPFEKLTWISVFLQLTLLLIKIKNNDF